MNIEEIITRTCDHSGITREELMSDTRKRDVVEALIDIDERVAAAVDAICEI